MHATTHTLLSDLMENLDIFPIILLVEHNSVVVNCCCATGYLKFNKLNNGQFVSDHKFIGQLGGSFDLDQAWLILARLTHESVVSWCIYP